MILTAIVNFETAKLLKEKEFESVNSNRLHRSYYNYLGEYRGDVTDYIVAKVGKLDTKPFESVDAPSIGQAVDWLFEEYGIWIIANIDIQDRWYFELFNIKSKRNSEILPDNEYWFNSPTEAYEAAINYCLTNLI